MLQPGDSQVWAAQHSQTDICISCYLFFCKKPRQIRVGCLFLQACALKCLHVILNDVHLWSSSHVCKTELWQHDLITCVQWCLPDQCWATDRLKKKMHHANGDKVLATLQLEASKPFPNSKLEKVSSSFFLFIIDGPSSLAFTFEDKGRSCIVSLPVAWQCFTCHRKRFWKFQGLQATKTDDQLPTAQCWGVWDAIGVEKFSGKITLKWLKTTFTKPKKTTTKCLHFCCSHHSSYILSAN